MFVLRNYNIYLKDIRLLSDINVEINSGGSYFIIGPNGSGKSSLGYSLSGKDNYFCSYGYFFLNNISLNNVSVIDRARMGLFLIFQYPLEISGISNLNFLFNLFNNKKKIKNEEQISYFDFIEFINNKLDEYYINKSILNRDLNFGLSGGEKKINEICRC